MIDTAIGTSADNFNSSTGFNPYIVRRGQGSGNADPDDITVQALLNFSAGTYATDFFVLFGVYGDLSTSQDAQQSSGIGPLIIKVSSDYGDAPASYGTLDANNGASHGIVSSLKLGSTVTEDVDGLPDANAAASTDDNAITLVTPIPNTAATSQIIPSYSVAVSTTNNIGSDAKLVGWIDWNNNGTFESTEAVSTTVTNGTTSAVLTWTGATLSGAKGRASTFLRLRLSTDANLTTATPTGGMINGEVEDYKIPFSIPLPLIMSYFEGEMKGSNTQLRWETLSEINTDYFDVEYSNDGISYTLLDRILASGKSSSPMQYTYLHDLKSISASSLFYRLKQVDLGGGYNYSKTLKLNNNNNASTQIDIFPNPADDILFVQYHPNFNDGVYSIIDMAGKVLKTERLSTLTNNCIDISSLITGSYYITITNSKQVRIMKFVVK